MLLHPYEGIFHDANLYTLQALARLHPESLAQDVFLRFGSQDRFTLFSPVYAAAINMLGVDHAASLLTCLSHLAVFAGGWYLARTVMPAGYALLGLAMLIALPGDYGAGRVFTCVEPFLTPRTVAEGLVLAAIAAAFSRRMFWCLASMAVATVLHPVMAAAGMAALFTTQLLLPYPRRALPVLWVLCGWLLLSAYALPQGEWGRLDADWYTLTSERSPFLLLSRWQLDDWSRAGVTLTILVIGSFTLEPRQRLLCRASALTMVGGLLLSGIAVDFLHLTLFMQGQPWRWQWLATLVASLSLPLIAASNWSRGAAGRTSSLLLISAWIFATGEFAIIASLTALLSLCFGKLKSAEQRLMFWGSCAMLLIASIWRIASNLEFTEAYYLNEALPVWLRRATSFAHDGLAPAAVFAAIAWMVRARPRRRLAWAASVTIGMAAIAALLPFAWRAWTREEFPRSQVESFAAWRRAIPPGAEVFWGESPLSVWVLLSRPNYISDVQTAGVVFSRDGAREMQRRASSLSGSIGPQTFLVWSRAGGHLALSRAQLEGICRLAVFDYLVSATELGMEPVASMPHLKLYRCAPQARAAAAT